jgi:hypothetical protein
MTLLTHVRVKKTVKLLMFSWKKTSYFRHPLPQIPAIHLCEHLLPAQKQIPLSGSWPQELPAQKQFLLSGSCPQELPGWSFQETNEKESTPDQAIEETMRQKSIRDCEYAFEREEKEIRDLDLVGRRDRDRERKYSVRASCYAGY